VFFCQQLSEFRHAHFCQPGKAANQRSITGFNDMSARSGFFSITFPHSQAMFRQRCPERF
jgi:hypothetical protein